MKKLIVALLLAGISQAKAATTGRALASCDGSFAVETRSVHAVSTTEFLGSSSSSGAWKSQGKIKCFRNNDSTAGNYVYISSFAITTLAPAVDTLKAIPIPGGNVADATVCFPWGPKLRTFLFTATGSRQVTAWFCE